MRMYRARRKNRVSISSIETLPDDVMINEVLRRVAASSLTSIANAKLSCKRLKTLTEDRCIYQHVSLNKIPIVEWCPLTNLQHKVFLKKCRQSENSESMYRQAVIEYFSKVNPDMESTIANLDRAVKAGHVGALYVKCIILLFSGNEDLKREGIKLIGNIKKSACLKRKLGSCRRKLMNELSEMWAMNPVLKVRPICCTTRHQRQYTNPWADEQVEDYGCRACDADAEINCVYASITQ